MESICSGSVMDGEGAVGGDRDRDRDPPQSCKLFIGGLSYDTTDASLSRYFEKYGQVASAVVMRDAATLRSRGFGFVTFCTLKAANDVVNFPKHVVDGRKVEAKFAVPRSSVSKSLSGGSESSSYSKSRRQAESSKHNGLDDSNFSGDHSSGTGRHKSGKAGKGAKIDNKQTAKGNRHRGRSTSSNSSGEKKSNGIIPNKVFVGGLLYATGHESLRNYFEQFGTVETAEVIYNRDTKKSRGFGFVVFKTFDAVRKVLYEQDNSRLVVDGKQVEVKLCMARQDSSQSLTKAMQDIDINSNPHPHQHSHNKAGDAMRNTKTTIPGARTIAPVENRWHNKLMVASFAQAINKPVETSFSSMESHSPNQSPSPRDTEVKTDTLARPAYEQPQNINIPAGDNAIAIPNELERGPTDMLGAGHSLEPVAAFSTLAGNTKPFKPRLRSPLTSPMSSPFAGGFLDEGPATQHVDSFFAQNSTDDTWGSPEQKRSSFDLSADYDLSSSLPPLDINSANDHNRMPSSFSEFCSSPISTSPFAPVEQNNNRIDAFKNHPGLFSPLSSSASGELGQGTDFSMFSSQFSNQGSFE